MNEFDERELGAYHYDRMTPFSIMILRIAQAITSLLKNTQPSHPDIQIDHPKTRLPCIICGNSGGFLHTHHRVPKRMGGGKSRVINTQNNICSTDHKFLDEQTYKGIIYTGTPDNPFHFTDIRKLPDIYFKNNIKPARHK